MSNPARARREGGIEPRFLEFLAANVCKLNQG
jgi:hypothetical protein